MKRIAFSLIGAGLIVTGLGAQEIQKRKENQEDRIAQGVKSGELTAGETANLERKETRVNREIRHDRAKNGGALAPKERRQINREQNHLRHPIYRGNPDGRNH